MNVFITYVDKSVFATLNTVPFIFNLATLLHIFCNKEETQIVVVFVVKIKKSLLRTKLHFLKRYLLKQLCKYAHFNKQLSGTIAFILSCSIIVYSH